jgi:hypothetical protein
MRSERPRGGEDMTEMKPIMPTFFTFLQTTKLRLTSCIVLLNWTVHKSIPAYLDSKVTPRLKIYTYLYLSYPT